MLSRRQFIRASVSAGIASAGAGIYTCCVEPHWVEFVERELPIVNLPRDLQRRRLVHLSDLHIGPRVDDAYLIRTFRRVTRLSADFVVYTGDFTSHEPDVFSHFREMVGYLPKGQLATLGILGNHDFGVNWAQPEVAETIARIAEGTGIRILRNELAQVNGLYFLGFDDLWAGRFQISPALDQLPPNAASIVLTHNPDTVDLPGWESYSGWVLAGHTHGGQCKPPFLPPPLLPVKNRRYTSGNFSIPGHRSMYINRGIGHLLQTRFNVRPEVTVFTLTRA